MGDIAADLGAAIGRPVDAIESIPEGHSGFTYWVTYDGDRRAVLRVPPPGARVAGPADIPRQGRIMRALAEHELPVPHVIAMSDEPVVDGRPFVLMEAVEGDRIEKVVGSVSDDQLASTAVDFLKRLHALPVNETGIGGEAPTTLPAEIARWAWLIERGPEELMARAPELTELLKRTAPAERPPTLVHGDFHYGNMLFREGRVVAVLDWEIAQVGQPLLDLACLSVVARSVNVDPGRGVPGGGSVTVDDSFLLSAYGAEAHEYEWYLALTFYKYAAIFGYNLMLHRRGKRPDPTYETRTGTIMAYIDEGIRILTSGSGI